MSVSSGMLPRGLLILHLTRRDDLLKVQLIHRRDGSGRLVRLVTAV